MRVLFFLFIIIFMGFTGCIRHSDQGLTKRFRVKNQSEKSNLKRLTINLPAEDMQATVNFYKEICGLEPVSYYPDQLNSEFIILARGDIEIMILKKDNFTEEFGEYKDKPLGGSFYLYFEVKDILMIYEKAVSKTKITKELHQTSYGTKEFTIKDNNGYIITFAETIL
jgi:uncharacterized glyoxalase superfamily protein PhnB